MTDGTNMYMPVAPAGNGYGDGMFGGNGAWWMMPRMSGHYYDDRSYSDGYSGGYSYPPRPRW